MQTSSAFSRWFERWVVLTGRRVNENQAARAWTAFVTEDTEDVLRATRLLRIFLEQVAAMQKLNRGFLFERFGKLCGSRTPYLDFAFTPRRSRKDYLLAVRKNAVLLR